MWQFALKCRNTLQYKKLQNIEQVSPAWSFPSLFHVEHYATHIKGDSGRMISKPDSNGASAGSVGSSLPLFHAMGQTQHRTPMVLPNVLRIGT